MIREDPGAGGPKVSVIMKAQSVKPCSRSQTSPAGLTARTMTR